MSGLLVAAALAEVAVRIVGLPKLARRLGISLEGAEDVSPPAPHLGRLDDDTIDRRAAAVDRVYRAWPRKDSCLRRALVLGLYIRRAGPLLRIGVAREGAEVRAHAWIEVDGRVIGDDTGSFAPLRRPARPAP